ncbi:restriction endonuclease subunit S [Streptosporangium amethystogenes]|uniref:restriction endonuclease subunit S n=1 Tax=Streptosporangium amethystogenes TaxID=2002 RepID=UPI0009FC32A3|nr:restriction endonuclease subunit S [Streptosporangium amethystogenes]
MRELPDGWRRVALREVTEERTEKVSTRRKITVLSSTKYQGLVPSDEYFKNRTIYSADLSGYKIVRRGWFAYATNHLAEGSIGLQEAFDVACVSPIYTVFSCHDDVYPPYMFRVLKSPDLLAKYGVHEQASVDRRGAVRYRDFRKIEVSIPSNSEQRRIAEILDTLDTQIANQREIFNKLKIVAAAMMDNHLTKIIRAADADFPLATLANIASGVTLGTETGGSIELPYLRVANVQDGYIDTSEMKSVNVSRTDAKRYLLEAGDVLLTEGGDLDKLGRGAVWDARIDPCICQNHIFRVRCDKNRLLPEYLAAYCSSHYGKSYFLSIAKQTTNLASINSTQLKNMPIPLPQIESQRHLIEMTEAGKERISDEDARLQRLELLKQGLTEDLLTGRVRVSEAEAVLESL